MNIALNDQTHSCPEQSRLNDIIRAEYGERAGMAVALNGEVVPRGQWADTPLNEGDRLDVFHAVAGG